MPLILGTNSIKDTTFSVANSLRFNSGSSDYLSRTYSSDGNQRTWTFSAWLKRSYVGSTGNLIFTYQDPSSNARSDISFANDKLYVSWNPTGSSWFYANSSPTRLFRDVSAWYHLVVSCDTTQATDTNRLKIYINGVQVGSDTHNTYPSQNQDTGFNKTGYVHEIGRYAHAGSPHFDGYMAEVVMIDGTALDPTSFGEFDEDSPNIWKPKNVSGLTFGTNGFYLDFENSGSLGADVSGNGNNFTVNNLTSIDQTTDTCTNNFATMNVLDSQGTYSEGNLKVQTADSGRGSQVSTIGVSTGKWYAEFKLTATSSSLAYVGIDTTGSTQDANGYVGKKAYGYSYLSDGRKVNNESFTSYGNSYTTGDIIGVALNLDDNELVFYKNGTAQNSGTAISITAPSSTDTGFYFFAFSDNEDTTGNVTFEANFGNPTFSISSGNSDGNGYGNFEYSVPSGYYALNTKNLAEYG